MQQDFKEYCPHVRASLDLIPPPLLVAQACLWRGAPVPCVGQEQASKEASKQPVSHLVSGHLLCSPARPCSTSNVAPALLVRSLGPTSNGCVRKALLHNQSFHNSDTSHLLHLKTYHSFLLQTHFSSVFISKQQLLHHQTKKEERSVSLPRGYLLFLVHVGLAGGQVELVIQPHTYTHTPLPHHGPDWCGAGQGREAKRRVKSGRCSRWLRECCPGGVRRRRPGSR